MPGHYNIYRGVGRPEAIDWDTPVAQSPAGLQAVELVGLGHDENVDYWYGFRGVSDADIEEQGTACVCRVMIDANGLLEGLQPSRPAAVVISQTLDGTVHLAIHYVHDPNAGRPCALQVADASPSEQDPQGKPDWNDLLAEIPIAGTARVEQAMEESWPHARLVRLAVRAVTQDGIPGPARLSNYAAADAQGPPAVDWLEAQQE